MPCKVIIIVTEVMFLGINIFRALLSAHFNSRLMALAKMSLSQGQHMLLPTKINSIVLLQTLMTRMQKHKGMLKEGVYV